MLNEAFSHTLGRAVTSSVSTAGVCAILSIADPKAAALGSLASFVVGHVFAVSILDPRKSLVAVIACLALKIFAGTKAGSYYDKNFDYADMCISWFTTALITNLAAGAIGINNLYIG